MIGKTIPHYRIEEKQRGGGMGIPEKSKGRCFCGSRSRIAARLQRSGADVSERKAFHGVSSPFDRRTLSSFYFCDCSGG